MELIAQYDDSLKENYNYYQYTIFQKIISKMKLHPLTIMNNWDLNITFMNLLFGFSIIKRRLECILISNPDRLCRMVPAAGFNPVERTIKCFLQFDSETGLEILIRLVEFNLSSLKLDREFPMKSSIGD